MTTMRDVAVRAGVSTATVSYVLNGKRFVQPHTRERVWRAIRELRYHVNDTARSLRRQTTSTLAMIVPDLENPFWPDLASVVLREAPTVGYDAVVYSIDVPRGDSSQLRRHYLQAIRGKRHDAIIYAEAVRLGSLSVKELIDTGTPVVLIGGWAHPGTDRVYIDDYAAARDVMSHLIGQGHTRIAHISGAPEMVSTEERARGYRDAMAEAALPVDPAFEVPGTFLYAGGQQAVRELLSRRPRPTAVFAANDPTALGALAGCIDAGLRVPDDIAIAGFDDIPLAAQVRPALTTVSHGQHQLGREAVRLAVRAHRRRLEEPGGGERETVIVRHRLIVRDSA